MTPSDPTTLEPLEKAPLVEVAAGIHFDTFADLEPVARVLYAQESVGRFPVRVVQPAIQEQAPVLPSRVGPMRTWLVSADAATLLQVQDDRMLLNWRAVGPAYPRFSAAGGVMGRALEEFAELTDFCQRVFDRAPSPRFVEVLKVDHLLEGTYWQGDDDLMSMLPGLGAMCVGSPFERPTGLLLRLHRGDDGESSVRLNLQLDRTAGGARMLRIETVATSPTDGPAIEAALADANRKANEVFSWLIPKPQRARFQGEDA